jgi:hypothetical protein
MKMEMEVEVMYASEAGATEAMEATEVKEHETGYTSRDTSRHTYDC